MIKGKLFSLLISSFFNQPAVKTELTSNVFDHINFRKQLNSEYIEN